MNIIWIYALNDPLSGKCRYIGQSSDPRRRYSSHLSHAKKKRNHRDCWIASLLTRNLKPDLEILEGTDVGQADFLESEYIRFFRLFGCDLVSGTLGGGGNRPTQATREKMRLAQTGKVRPTVSIDLRTKSVFLSGARRSSRSNFKGVQFCSDGSRAKRWQGKLTVNKKILRTKRFHTPEEAARAYDCLVDTYRPGTFKNFI